LGRGREFDELRSDSRILLYDATRVLPAATMTELTSVLASEVAGRQPCLKIGVGTGRFALPLRAAGIAMARTDISGAMLRRLAAHVGGAKGGMMRVSTANQSSSTIPGRRPGSVAEEGNAGQHVVGDAVTVHRLVEADGDAGLCPLVTS
jgi:hypothetical protein